MVDDLIAHHLHTGMTKEEVESVLGKFDGELDGRIQYYSLLQYPRWDQRLISLIYMKAWNPELILTYDGKDLTTLRHIEVMSWYGKTGVTPYHRLFYGEK